MKNHPIRILFICGSLEPGKDGVGDYTLKLAKAIETLGCQTAIVALYDKHLVTIKENRSPTELKTLRLPSKLTTPERYKALGEFQSVFQPEWVSLQYVPYAYSSQGLPFNLASHLAKIFTGIWFHLMIHEAYLGENLSFKNKLVRRGQMAILRGIQKNLNPNLIQTTIPWYSEQLRAIGIESTLLGLFGNIPVLANGDSTQTNSFQSLQAIYFGALPHEPNWGRFADQLHTLIKTRKLQLTFVGNTSAKWPNFKTFLNDRLNDESLEINALGPKSEAELSALFQHVDFAISRVPPNLIGKSGSAIGMLEHGLRLWIPLAKSQDEILKYVDYRADQCFADIEELLACKGEFGRSNRISEVANQLVADLISAK